MVSDADESAGVRVRDSGLDVLEQAVIECAPRQPRQRATGQAEEVLFVVDGAGELCSRRRPGTRSSPRPARYLAPGEEYELETAGRSRACVSVRIADPVAADRDASRSIRALRVRRLADQEEQVATTSRTFRIVADPSTGLRSATHFVGYVPTERAPEHFHTYDEVIYMIEGQGTLHTGATARRSPRARSSSCRRGPCTASRTPARTRCASSRYSGRPDRRPPRTTRTAPRHTRVRHQSCPHQGRCKGP